MVGGAALAAADTVGAAGCGRSWMVRSGVSRWRGQQRSDRARRRLAWECGGPGTGLPGTPVATGTCGHASARDGSSCAQAACVSAAMSADGGGLRVRKGEGACVDQGVRLARHPGPSCQPSSGADRHLRSGLRCRDRSRAAAAITPSLRLQAVATAPRSWRRVAVRRSFVPGLRPLPSLTVDAADPAVGRLPAANSGRRPARSDCDLRAPMAIGRWLAGAGPVRSDAGGTAGRKGRVLMTCDRPAARGSPALLVANAWDSLWAAPAWRPGPGRPPRAVTGAAGLAAGPFAGRAAALARPGFRQ